MSNNKIIPATSKLKLMNGEEIELLMNFSALNLLREKDKNMYSKINKFIFSSAGDINKLDLLEIAELIYSCYQMHQLFYQQKIDKTFNDFIEVLDFDLENLMITYNTLLLGDKKKALKKYSESVRQNQEEE